MDFRFIEMDIPLGVKGTVLSSSIGIQHGPSFSPERLSSCLTVFILYSKINSPSPKGLLFNNKAQKTSRIFKLLRNLYCHCAACQA